MGRKGHHEGGRSYKTFIQHRPSTCQCKDFIQSVAWEGGALMLTHPTHLARCSTYTSDTLNR